MALEHKITSFPQRPGVYLFKDKDGEIIYVGKAKKLRARVRQYFAKELDERPQVQFLMKRVRDVDYIVTDTEKEALLLENTLIKKHQPRYNVSLKDDKTFLSIRIGLEHQFPGISATRHPKKDGARYFGPYASGLACREVVDEIVGYFKIRSCNDREFANRVRPCLLHDINRCTAPCVGKVTAEAYRTQIEEAMLFLEGKRRELNALFRGRMRSASESHRYEEAAHYRDLIAGIEGMVEKQKVIRHGAGDRDVVGVARDERAAAACVLFIRGGTLIGKRTQRLGTISDEEAQVLESFLLRWYDGPREIPREIVLSQAVEGRVALREILAERCGRAVTVKVPRRGEDLGLARLAVDNAREALRLERDVAETTMLTLEQLQTKLMLPHLPDVIECLDISNIHGRDAYGSLITFVTGEPEKSRYRLYRIRTIERPDDYTMMREVLERRFRPPREDISRTAALRGRLQRLSRWRGRREPLKIDELAREERRRAPPDLLLIDGGKGQLNVARKVLAELGIHDVPLAAIAKGESKGRERDEVYLPGRKNPLTFRRGSQELLLLMRIRDEAHRFGIAAHRKRRIKSLVQPR